MILATGLGLAAGPIGAQAAEPIPPLVTTLQTVVDGAGDVVNTVTSSLFDSPRADITGASLEYAPGWIRMKVQLKNTIDPLKDEAWSDDSNAEWALDTNADGQPEYTVEFATDSGELYGAVFDFTKPDAKSLCDADSASYSPQDGYTLVIDPACIGKPQKLGYNVTMFLDTDPKDDKAPIAVDQVPDQGFKEVAAPVQPGEAPPVAPNAAPPVTRVPTAAPGSAPAPTTAPSRAGQAVKPGSAAAPVPAPDASPTTAAPAPSAPLARTGSASETRALFGVGIMLLGAGLLVMTKQTRRLRPLA